MDDDFEIPYYDEYFFFVPLRSAWNEFLTMFRDLDDVEVLDYISLTEE